MCANRVIPLAASGGSPTLPLQEPERAQHSRPGSCHVLWFGLTVVRTTTTVESSFYRVFFGMCLPAKIVRASGGVCCPRGVFAESGLGMGSGMYWKALLERDVGFVLLKVR